MNLPLPSRGSIEERAFSHLLKLDPPKGKDETAIAKYIGGHLGRIAGEDLREIEKTIPQSFWLALFAGVPPDSVASYLRSRLNSWDVWPVVLEAFLTYEEGTSQIHRGRSERTSEALSDVIAELVDSFSESASPEFEWAVKHPRVTEALASLARSRTSSRSSWRYWLRRWLINQAKSEKFRSRHAFADLATDLLETDDFNAILSYLAPGLEPIEGLAREVPSLYTKIRDAGDPASMAERIILFWKITFDNREKPWTKQHVSWSELNRLIHGSRSDLLSHLALPLGFSLGLVLADVSLGVGWTASGEGVDRFLQNCGLPPYDSLPVEVRVQGQLWRELKTLATYQAESYRRETEILGLRSSLTTMASESPGEWARALPWILAAAHDLGGLAEAVTVAVALENEEVATALTSLAEDDGSQVVRDRARGVLALWQGLPDPTDQVRSDLLSLAARQFDGTPATLERLSGPSSTWLSSVETEAQLRSGVAAAEQAFRDYFSTQGGIEEEANTAQLVELVRNHLTAAQDRLLSLRKRGPRGPHLALAYRQVPKTEEAEFGCDVAFLINAHQGTQLLLTTGELVQVKKPSRGTKRKGSLVPPFVDRWRIDTRQLLDIVRHSGTAVYWLIGPSGDILVLPAKVLNLLASRPRRLRRSMSATFSIDYFDVRAASIPLAQFMVDLVAGLWLGSTDAELLRFIRGENQRTVPRLVLEIDIDLAGGENRG